jgi:outer membrane biosynthesis protein TonB
MSTVVRAGLLVVLTALSGACVTTRAATPADRPALVVPPPPPRVITPPPVAETTPQPEPVGELPTASKPPARPRPPQPKEPVKPDPKPETPPDTAPIPPVTPPLAQPQLRVPESGDASARQVRDIIERTRRMLLGIDYGPLSDVRKKAYDDAKIFAQQAEDALKLNNVVFAKELADKAERLAKELQGR